MQLIIKSYDIAEPASATVTPIEHPFGERYYMEIYHKLPNGDSFLDRASGDYRNARMLSEALRDAIGYGPARDLLRAHGVKDGEPLMYLGRNN